MKPYEIIKRLEKMDGRLVKLELVKTNMFEELIRGMEMAFDPFTVFGIKKLPAWKNENYNGPGKVYGFYELCSKLVARELTGNAARNAVEATMSLYSEDEWEYWYKRILLKDFKCGVGVDSWNAVAEKPVTLFKCQLAKDTPPDDVEEGYKRSNIFIEPKFDGVRAISFVFPVSEKDPKGKVVIYSRNGKVFDNFNGVEQALLELNVPVAMMFDGEMMSKNFQSLMTQVNRKKDVNTSDAVYHIFDGMMFEQYEAGYCSFSQKQRKEWLEQVLYNRNNDRIVISPYEYVGTSNPEKIAASFKLFVSEGFEGMMVKGADDLYTFERGKEWMKLKPFIDITLTVTGVEAGSSGSKYENTLGALICEGEHEGKTVKVSCGGGFTDQMRAQIWANYTGQPTVWKKKVKGSWVNIEEQPFKGVSRVIVGHKVEIRGDVLTLATDAETWSLRFPRFKHFREEWDMS